MELPVFTVVDPATVDAFRRGDRDAFGLISRRHFRELHVHCYRMIGSFDEAEELVQDTLLRAWRGRDSYEGRATVRAWLYRIATNVCIDAMRKRKCAPSVDVLPDPAADEDEQPDAQVVARETIESAFLAAARILPAKQFATLILREVLGFSAIETAQLLDDTVPAVNSALQRARATLRRRYGRSTDTRRTTASGATPPLPPASAAVNPRRRSASSRSGPPPVPAW